MIQLPFFRHSEAFTAPPLLPGDSVNTQELRPPDQPVGFITRVLNGEAHPPKKPRPCTRDKLPSLPSLSLRSVKLSAFKEEYLAHSVHAQGVSDVRCLLSHQLATIKTPRAALHPQTWAEGEVQCVNSRNTAERSWQ